MKTNYKRNILLMSVAMVLAACGAVDQGDIGVRTNFNGSVEPTGIEGFYTSWTSHVTKYSAKENSIELQNLTPKAHDNLSLKELDVTIYYRVLAAKIPGLVVKYSGQSLPGEHEQLPAAVMVMKIATNAVNEEVAKLDSLTVHLNRELMSKEILGNIQSSLDKNDPDTFTVTRVLIQKVLTDPTIEQSIQAAVANQKNLENKATQVKIAEQDANIEVAKARGIAQAQGIINQTLTREYLQHEFNTALMTFAQKGGTNTVLVPYGSAAPLVNIPAK